MISENSKGDSSSQPDEKEEDEELFFPGIHEYYKLLKFVIKLPRIFDLRFEFVK